MPTGEINTKVRESIAAFYGSMAQMRTADPFDGLSRRVPAPGGFFKIADVYPVGKMEDAIGIATLNGLQAASKIVNTKARRWSGGIDYEQWLTGDANSGGQVSRAIRISAMHTVNDSIKRKSRLLVRGGTLTDMFTTTDEGSTASTAFADTKFIPRSNKSFDNAISGSYTDSAAEFRTAVMDALAQFDVMQNAIGGILHTPPEQGARYVVMVPPALRQLATDALFPQLQNDAANLGNQLGISLRVNPWLASGALDNFVEGETSLGSSTVFYVFRVDTTYEPLVEGWRGPEEFRSTFGRDEAHLILFNQHVFQPYYAAEYDYGSSFNMIRVTNT